MGLASMFSGQVFFAPLQANPPLQPAEVEQIITIAWQWLVLVAVIAWLGTLIAECRLLAAFKGQQRSEITAILHIAVQRQRRQGWLWLSITLVGTATLFWLRLSHVLPDQQLNQPPDWLALERFLIQAPEGWLWLARGSLALVALSLLAVLSFSAWRRTHAQHTPGRASSRGRSAHTVDQSNEPGKTRPGDTSAQPQNRSAQSNFTSSRLIATQESMQRRLLAEQRGTQLSLVIAIALLFTIILANPALQFAQLPITLLALSSVALLAFAAWLGSILYLAFVLTPATHVIDNAERTQTLVELLPAIRPPLAQAIVALALSAIFLGETHLTSFSSLPTLLTSPASWLLIGEAGILGVIMLLTFHQKRRTLPHLARMAWLAARGTLMGVLSGMDMSRALQITQQERQRLANRAERRLTRSTALQATLGVVFLLCLVLGWFFTMPPTL